MTNQYRYFLESNFAGINRLFALGYSNRDDDVKRLKAQIYYVPKGIIKNYNSIINREKFFNVPTESHIK